MKGFRKGTKVMVRYFGVMVKGVYVRPAATEGKHYIRVSTPSGGDTRTYFATSFKRRSV